MKLNLNTSTFAKRFLFTFPMLVLLAGCGAKEFQCKEAISAAKAAAETDPDAPPAAADTRCNFYHPNSVANAPVLIVGDSFWDYGEGYGAIPKKMVEKTGDTYFEVARSGATTKYLLSVVQGDPAANNPLPLNNGVDFKTILLNGGANNIRDICKAGAEDRSASAPCRGVNATNNTSLDTLTCACQEGLDAIRNDLRPIIAELSAIETVDHIVFAGPQKFPTSQAYPFIQDIVRAHSELVCSEFSKCSFVDNSTLWDHNNSGCYIYDNQHVTKVAAGRIADNILNHLKNINSVGMEDYVPVEVPLNQPCNI